MEIGNLWVKLGLGSNEFKKGIQESQKDARTFGQVLSGVFKTATSSAQASLQSLGQVKLKDILQMPEFKSAVSELRDLQLEYALTSSKMKTTATETEKLEAQLGHLNSVLTTHQKGMDAVRQAYEKAAAEKGKDSTEAKKLETQLKKLEIAESNLKNGIHDTESALKKQTTAVDASEGEFRKLSNQMNGFGNSTNFVSAAIKGLIAGIGFTALSTKAIDAAADMQAMNSQFEQVFGDLQSNAQKTVDSLGEDFNMLPNRLKAPFTMMTSMFMGLGYDTTEAMTLAKDGVTLAADAAAFFDKSYEDANSALNSFIKGNYEGGEAIGLFANETQLATYASKELGLDWKNLDEAGKQLARLEYAKAMQEAAGATGQASRKSDSYANQMGNLKQAWQDFLAVAAAPLLEPVVAGIKNITEGLSGLTESGSLETWGERISNIFTGVSSIFKLVKDNANILIPAISGLATSFVAMRVVGVVTTLMNAYKNSLFITTSAQKGLNVAMRENMIGIVITAIGLLVAAGVALYTHWDTISAKASEVWQSIRAAWDSVRQNTTEAWDSVTQVISNAWQAIVGLFLQYTPLGIIISHWGDISSKTTEMWGGHQTNPTGTMGRYSFILEKHNTGWHHRKSLE